MTKLTTKATTNTTTPSPRTPKIREALVTMNVRDDEGVATTNVRKDTHENDELATDTTNCECIDRGSNTKEMRAMHTVQRSTPDTIMYEYKNLTSHKPTEILVR